MGREVRMIPPNWQHPVDRRGHYIPLHGRDILEYVDEGDDPITEDKLMPDFGSEATHYCMYETCTEGTPISPAFATPEDLAHWLADTGASAFGRLTATYEQWLSMIRRGSAVSVVISNGVMDSGVAALHEYGDDNG